MSKVIMIRINQKFKTHPVYCFLVEKEVVKLQKLEWFKSSYRYTATCNYKFNECSEFICCFFFQSVELRVREPSEKTSFLYANNTVCHMCSSNHTV